MVTTPATETTEGVETRTCKTCGEKETRPIARTFTSVARLKTWLTSQPANTATTPYNIKLIIGNQDDFASLRTTINAEPEKYIYLDLSGSTVTSIPDYAFHNSSKNTGCATLVGITIQDTVTSIGTLAFYYCTNLTSVTIPNSVTRIGNQSFVYCTSLTSVTIPDSVTSIGGNAFYGCTGLTSVTIPDSVTSIGGSAFYGCTNLASVTIPNNVTSIGNNAFAGTAWLNNQQNGVVYINKIAYVYNGTMPANTSITLANDTIEIASGAFYNQTNLASVTIPDSVTTIGNYAFYGCTGLASVIIPDNVTSIEGRTFYNCTSLASVTIGSGVNSIGWYAFGSCTSLTNIIFKSTIASSEFSDGAFYSLGDLRDKFYATDATKGTPGTYTTTAPVGSNSTWQKQ